MFSLVGAFCAETADVFKFIGNIVTVFKTIIPVILIVLGVVALGKAVLAADDKEIKTAVNGLIKKFLVAVLIFFLPMIVNALFGLVDGFNGVKSDAQICVNCITSPRSNCPKSINSLN